MDGCAPRHAMVIASGGLDSTAVAYRLADQGSRLTLLSFDYGQRHCKELRYAAHVAERLDTRHEIVNLVDLGGLWKGSALTDRTVAVPDGRYADATMRITVVPNRNAIMLSVAIGAALAAGADAVAFGAHAGDHTIYPDCRPEFFDLFERATRAGNEGFIPAGFQFLAPFLHATKAEVVRTAAELRVPFRLTWSCYRGGERHCGRCATCMERIEAFATAGVEDPTEYDAPPAAGVSR